MMNVRPSIWIALLAVVVVAWGSEAVAQTAVHGFEIPTAEGSRTPTIGICGRYPKVAIRRPGGTGFRVSKLPLHNITALSVYKLNSVGRADISIVYLDGLHPVDLSTEVNCFGGVNSRAPAGKPYKPVNQDIAFVSPGLSPLSRRCDHAGCAKAQCW